MSAAPRLVEGLVVVAEQLELLFDAPAEAPGRTAAKPSQMPTRRGCGPERPSDGFAEPTRHLDFLTPADGLTAQERRTVPQFRRGARWWASRSATGRTAVTTSTADASTRRR